MESSTIDIFTESGDCFELNKPNLSEVLSYLFQWTISAVGIMGNLAVVIIFTRKPTKAHGEYIIIVISVIDFLMSVFSILFTVLLVIWKPNVREVGCFVPLCIVGNIAYDVTNTFSSLMMCLMSVSRYYAVCCAHEYKTKMSVERQAIYCSAILIISIPSCTLQVVGCVVSAEVSTRTKLAWVVQRTLLVLLTFVCLTLCYTKVIRNLHQRKVNSTKVKYTGCIAAFGGVKHSRW